MYHNFSISNVKVTPIDQYFAGIRVQRMVSNRSLKKSYISMLEGLAARGLTDQIKAIAANRLDINDAWQSYRRNKSDRVVVVEHLIPAETAFQDFLDRSQLSEGSKRSYRQHFGLLLRNGEPIPEPDAATGKIPQNGKRRPTIDQIPKLVEDFRVTCLQTENITTFKNARAAALSFAKHTTKKYSPLWFAIAEIPPLEAIDDYSDPDRVNKHKGEARGVADMFRVCRAMREPYGRYLWDMSISGMRTSEYFMTPFTLLDNGIDVRGKKNKWAKRVTLLVEPIKKPERTLQIMRDWLREVEPTWHPYDGRRSFCKWCEDSGIAWTRAEMYAGHKNKNTHMIYTRSDTEPYRDADAELFRSYIRRSLEAAKQPKLERAPVTNFYETL
jgi:hypothetical protein